MLYIHSEFRKILQYAQGQGDKIAGTLLISDSAHVKTDEGNYLAFISDECQLSYRPANRIDSRLTSGSVTHYEAQGRMVGRPGRVARKFLTGQALEGLTDVDFERFANNLETFREYAGEIRLVAGAEIRTWYSARKYAYRQGSLNQSCMAYERCQPYFSIYTQNSAVCQMAILTKPDATGNELLYGRALVWTLTDGRRMLDRVYGTDKTIRHMKKWAADQGMIDREESGALREPLSVQLKSWRFGTYPYLDTLLYLNQKTGVLSNHPHGMATATLHGTHGTDFMGVTLQYRIPIIRGHSTNPALCEIAYAVVNGASVRGAQRCLTNRLSVYWQNGFGVAGVQDSVREIVRGMAAMPEKTGWVRNPWRKMTALEMRYFGMEIGTTLD